MFIVNYVHHTKTGDVVAPTVTFNTDLEWKAHYHSTFAYSIAAEDVTGIDYLVSNENYQRVFDDHLKKPVVETEPFETE